ERVFVFGRAEALHDEVADVDYRVILSTGAGYYFVKNTNTDFDVEVGPGYIFQKEGGADDDYATIRFGEVFNQKISDRAKFWEKAEYLPKVSDTENYIVNAEVGVSAALSADKKFSLVTTLNYTYNSVPASGRLKNDTMLKTGINYAF